MKTVEEARAFFANDKYATEATGIVIDEASENYAKCSLKIKDIHKNATGTVMGGALFTLADFVFAVATNFGGNMTVSSVSQISFLTSPKGDTLTGESKLIKDGKNLCFYEIEIKDNLGNKVASVSISGCHINKNL